MTLCLSEGFAPLLLNEDESDVREAGHAMRQAALLALASRSSETSREKS
jgi:hypothetical protein